MVAKEYYRKVRRRKMQFLNKLRLRLSRGKKTIGLVSCDLWKNRVYDDLLLQRAFLKSGIKAEIISWQDSTTDFKKYDALLVTSMWGYQKNILELESWLNKVSDLKIYNTVDIIKNNYNKTKQINLLRKNNLPTIKTIVYKASGPRINDQEILESINSTIGDFPLVVKPSISSGGENTFLIKNLEDLKKVFQKFWDSNNKSDLLIQPYISEVQNGEISIIAIDKKIINAVVRFPGVIGKERQYQVKRIDIKNLDSQIIKLCKKVIRLKEFDEQLYMRIDVIKKDGCYNIMEVEMFEPQLFYYLLRGSARRKMLQAMVSATEKRLHK